MIPQPEKYIISLETSAKHLQTADHLAYITFPLIKENKLLLKILEELNFSLLNAINAILQYEYTYKRISIYQNARDNLETFKRLAPRYSLNPSQLAKLLDILNIEEKHKKSPFEFTKSDKIVIMSENNQTDSLGLERVKDWILELKDLLRKANMAIRKTI